MESVWGSEVVWIESDEDSCNSFRCKNKYFHSSDRSSDAWDTEVIIGVKYFYEVRSKCFGRNMGKDMRSPLLVRTRKDFWGYGRLICRRNIITFGCSVNSLHYSMALLRFLSMSSILIDAGKRC